MYSADANTWKVVVMHLDAEVCANQRETFKTHKSNCVSPGKSSMLLRLLWDTENLLAMACVDFCAAALGSKYWLMLPVMTLNPAKYKTSEKNSLRRRERQRT